MNKLKNNKNIINFFFLGLCIPLKILMFSIPLIIDKKNLFYYSFILFLLSIVFLFLYFFNLIFNINKNDWWCEFRLIHGMLYLIAAIYAFQMKQIAWIPLCIDFIVGFILFSYHNILTS